MLSSFADVLAANAHWLFLGSVLSLIVASVVGAWFIARLPSDYFLSEKRRPARLNHWVVRLVLIVLKNAVGILLILAGTVMLFTPGQGLLTLFAGLVLTNFPGKYALERRLARNHRVMRVLNWMRARYARPPFTTPTPPPQSRGSE